MDRRLALFSKTNISGHNTQLHTIAIGFMCPLLLFRCA